MFWKKSGLLCIVLAALAIVGVAQTSKPRGRSANLQATLGYLGVGVQDIGPEDARSVKVTRIEEGEAGAKAGLRLNDLILEFNEKKIESSEEFTKSIMSKSPGTAVKLTISRNGTKQTLAATLGVRPEGLPIAEAQQGILIPAAPISPEELQALIAGDAPRVGFVGQSLPPQLAEFFGVREGVLVQSVTAKSPADKAGLRAGDIVIKVNGIPVTSPREITGIVRPLKKPVTFTVFRNRKEITLSIELAWNATGRISVPECSIRRPELQA